MLDVSGGILNRTRIPSKMVIHLGESCEMLVLRDMVSKRYYLE